MRDVLDVADLWMGPSASAQVFGDKHPVALDDAVSLLVDGGPVTINVTANDFDPEDGTVTLVSAVAALGTAVAEANNTVTYTPIPGFSGSDSIVYEIADSQDQRSTGQVNITVSEAQLSIDVAADNTMSVSAETGPLDLTVTNPPEFAGVTQFNTGDLQMGPVNLEAPGVSGTPAVGEVLTASDGLWVYDDGAGIPTQSWQWHLGGAAIPGALSETYTVQAGDIGPGLSVVETVGDAFGSRSASSVIVGAAFQPLADAALLSWWDASDAATITETAGVVSQWADKAGGTALVRNFEARRPETGIRTIGGLNVLDFDGTKGMDTSRLFPASGDVAFHMVVEVDSIANAFEAILSVNATNDFQLDAGSETAFTGRYNSTGLGPSGPFSGGPFTGPLILSAIFDRTGAGTVTCYVGDVLRTTASYSTAFDANAELYLMENRSQNVWTDGAIGELIITGDTANRADYHTYLSAKWGIT
ncbi:MAG: Ig-like domain-containing protein [Pseudomonadota bacterium]